MNEGFNQPVRLEKFGTGPGVLAPGPGRRGYCGVAVLVAEERISACSCSCSVVSC